MRYSLRKTTAATQLPVSMQEIREHLSLADNEQHYDQMIRRLAFAAVETIEAETGRQMLTATYTLGLDCLPPGNVPIELPYPPLQSVSSITIDGSAYTSHTVDTGFPGRIIPPNTGWPDLTAQYNGVSIVYVAGETEAASVPDVCKHAVLLLVGHWFANREAVTPGSMSEIPMGVKRLVASASAGDEFQKIWNLGSYSGYGDYSGEVARWY